MIRAVVAAIVLAPFIGAVVVLRWAAGMFPPEFNEIEEGL